MLWVLLLSFLAIVGVLVFKILARLEPSAGGVQRSPSSRLPTGEPDAAMIQRISLLAPELQRTDVNLRNEAERLMRAGQLDDAIILLFGHQLILLDRAGWLRLAQGQNQWSICSGNNCIA